MEAGSTFTVESEERPSTDSAEFTFKLYIPQVQDRSQHLADVPVLRIWEHEDLHSWADVGIILRVIPAVTGHAVALQGTTSTGKESPPGTHIGNKEPAGCQTLVHSSILYAFPLIVSSLIFTLKENVLAEG